MVVAAEDGEAAEAGLRLTVATSRLARPRTPRWPRSPCTARGGVPISREIDPKRARTLAFALSTEQAGRVSGGGPAVAPIGRLDDRDARRSRGRPETKRRRRCDSRSQLPVHPCISPEPPREHQCLLDRPGRGDPVLLRAKNPDAICRRPLHALSNVAVDLRLCHVQLPSAVAADLERHPAPRDLPHLPYPLSRPLPAQVPAPVVMLGEEAMKLNRSTRIAGGVPISFRNRTIHDPRRYDRGADPHPRNTERDASRDGEPDRCGPEAPGRPSRRHGAPQAFEAGEHAQDHERNR